ncbi:Flp pilus assembly protein CpaB [Texcoconibacillus texcoconensis]|uniref:Flp pilus assembly protein CpaB n=1 Tax=Texcoconibacillus texcoconensis TaxID=1095777 RepID=A0A840QQ39_9BACI|nr:Flp pilus assembly protein CpaB [Texcoconibacillus texcoconensis]MBB5173480.1 Flp pilus assembly protein CpaB [Texcoconibacillus texcoconensis]
MTNKRVWLIASIFGLITAGILMIIFVDTNQQDSEIVEEEFVVEEELTEEEEDLTALPIADGYRAISIAVSGTEGVSGFIRSGDYVDVVSLLPSLEEEVPASQLLLQNIYVLSVGGPSNRGVEEDYVPYETVTLEVTPEQGATLALAAENASIVLMLRGEGDGETVRQRQITIEQLVD